LRRAPRVIPGAQAWIIVRTSLTIAVLIIRYGHVKYPYREDREGKNEKPYVRE